MKTLRKLATAAAMFAGVTTTTVQADNSNAPMAAALAELAASQAQETKVEQGFCYIYRVLYPERGTLEVRRRRDGELEIGQFKLAHNREPSNESWMHAREWFDQDKVQRTE